jgi:hypothetical protein
MKLAVMQPYFFPYSGYFSLIHSVDHFMFFDDVQYLRKSWMSRNRLLNIDKKEPYFIRPTLIKTDYKALLTSVKLDSNDKWKLKLLEQLNAYKNKAPFYQEVRTLIESIFQENCEYLSTFNIKSTVKICNALGFNTKFDKYTDYNFWFDEKPGEGDWGRVIAKELNASHYINSPGGESFIMAEPFSKINMKLGFIQPELKAYNQMNGSFTPGLSIIDMLLFNGFKQTAALISEYKIKWK